MSTLEETMELIRMLSETDQLRVRDFAIQLTGQQREVLPGRKYKRITVQDPLQDDAIDTMYAELRIG